MWCLHQRKHTAGNDLVNSIIWCKKQFMQLTRACSVFQNWCWLQSQLQTGSLKTLSIIFRTAHSFFRSATISNSFIDWININGRENCFNKRYLVAPTGLTCCSEGRTYFWRTGEPGISPCSELGSWSLMSHNSDMCCESHMWKESFVGKRAQGIMPVILWKWTIWFCIQFLTGYNMATHSLETFIIVVIFIFTYSWQL